MKTSNYNIFWYSKDIDKYILYNTYTDAIEAFSVPTAKIVKSILGNEPYMGSTAEQVGLGALCNHLYDNGFLIDSNRDELEEIRFQYNRNKFGDCPSKSLGIALAPSMACNFDCVYCYASLKSGSIMTKNTLDVLIERLKCTVKERGLKSLSFTWIGGEPLCNVPAIRRICSELHEFCVENSCQFSTSLVTNGSLFTEELAEEMSKAPFELKHIQITLDAFWHEESRPFKNRKGSSLEATLSGIKSAAKYFPCGTTIRVNVPNSPDATAEKLSEYLIDIIKTLELPDTMSMYIAPVDPSTEEARLNVASEWDPVLFAKLREQVSEALCAAKNRNVLPQLLRRRPIPCGYESRDSICIDASGYIYKCWHHIGRPDMSLGTIMTGINHEHLMHSSVYQQWMTWNPLKTMCKKCKLLPTCMGFCFDFAATRGPNAKGRCMTHRYSFKSDCIKYAEYIIQQRELHS